MPVRFGSLLLAVTLLCVGITQAQGPSAEGLPRRTGLRPKLIGVGHVEEDEDRALNNTALAAFTSSPEPLVALNQDAVPVPPAPMMGVSNPDANQESSVVKLVVGRGRIMSVPAPIVKQGDVAVIAVGDPSVADFEVLPNPRLLRLTGKRPGMTDLTLVTSDDQTLVYELQVQYDLTLLEARLRQSFPSALVRISQLGNHLILEGQARDHRQSYQIENLVRAYIESLNAANASVGRGASGTSQALMPQDLGAGSEPAPSDYALESTVEGQLVLRAVPEMTARAQFASLDDSQIINLITLPGIQQVMLQVRIAELNRTALREIGSDLFYEWGPGNILGTNIAGATSPILQGMQSGTDGGMGPIGPDLGPNSTAFGIFPNAKLDIILRALRENAVLRILAEPNLVSLSGHEASFLAGGEFPVPVAQGNALGAGGVTVRYKEFGVQLNFVPLILDDEVIRLEVRPEVSSIDDTLGTTLVVGGDPTPGVTTRRVHTTVEMREGETLALAGLLQVKFEAGTSRIPGLGDLPYIGPLFSNTSHFKEEKELLVLVTPYLVSPMNSCDAPPLPGAEIEDPNDLEFYFLNRIEGRTGRGFRSTTSWDDPFHLVRRMKLERDQMCGPVGFSSCPGQVLESK